MDKITKVFSKVGLVGLITIALGLVILKNANAYNLALKQPATANSVYDPVTYAAAKANDGDLNTRWASASGPLDYPYEWEVDLGGFYSINRIKISWEAASSVHYQLLTSRDGVNYTVLLDSGNLSQGTRTDDWNFAITSGIRYVKFKNLMGWAGIVSMWEFEVYGFPAFPNAALTKPVTTNSVGDPIAYAASKANDGDLTTRWATASEVLSYPYEWEVDLGELYDINRVRIYWEAASSVRYEILTSRDRVNYTVLLDSGSLSQGTRTDDWNFAITSGIRYVKFRNIMGWAGIVSMWEFEVYGIPSLYNVGLKKSATANSVYDPVVYAAAKANDGDLTTRWASASGPLDYPYEWEVDLGGFYGIGRLIVYWEAASSVHYEILTSRDRVNYTRLLDTGNLTQGTRTDDWSFAITSGIRYVKFRNLMGWTGIVSMWEFEVYGFPEVALNKPASANSVYDPIAYAAAKANDGDLTTRWASASGPLDYPYEWEVDLRISHKINRVRIYWEAASSVHYEILTSTDRVNYTRLLDSGNLSQGTRTDDWSFATTSGIRYVKFRNIMGWTGIVSMWEFEVYGFPDGQTVVDLTGGVSGITGKYIYRPGNTVTISANLTNPNDSTGGALFEYQISDFFGSVVNQGSADLKVNPNAVINYQPQKKGSFYVSYTVKDGNLIVQSGKMSFIVIPAETAGLNPDLSPFGIVYGIPDMMGNAGIKWHRSDFYWPEIEPQQGAFNWATPDSVVSSAQTYGYNMMPILDYTPIWASTAPPGTPDSEKWHYPPQLSPWSNFVTQAVNRYKNSVKYWEIWNEPDGYPNFFTGTPEQYGQVLQNAYQSAKGVDPTSKVIGGVTASWSIGFLQRVFQSIGTSYMDILSVHPYRFNLGSPEKTNFLGEMSKLRAILDIYGGTGKPIWLTEFQWPADDIDPSSPEFVSKGKILTEKQQADYLSRLSIQGLSKSYINKLFWFTMKHPSPNLADSPDSGAGLLRQDYSAKPSFVAYRNMSDLLYNVTPITSTDSTSLKSYTFTQPNGQQLMAVWNINGRDIIDVNGPNTNTDLMGNESNMSGGRNWITIGQSPVFLKGNSVTLSGGVMDINWGDGDVLNTWDVRHVFVKVSNPTQFTLSGTLTMASPEFTSSPASVTINLAQGVSQITDFSVSSSDINADGRRKLKFKLSLGSPFSQDIIQETELLLSPWTKVLYEESFEGDISAWQTNATEAVFVEYNTIAKSTLHAHSGQYSLKWRCKSWCWSNIFKYFSQGINPNTKAIEYWMYLDNSATGAQVTGPVIIQNAQYGAWGKSPLPVTGKWQRYVIPLSELQKGVGNDPDGTIQLYNPLYLYLNYPNGEMEAYVDDIRFLGR